MIDKPLYPDKPIDVYESYLKSVDEMKKKYSLTSMQVPRVIKIVLSTSLGQAATEKGYFKDVGEAISNISCRKPVVARAKKSVAAFKVREGMDVGYFVTLRKRAMYDFINRFVYITLPRVRDFKGLSKRAFDGQFNYNIGIKDSSAFHEVDVIKLGKSFGLNVSLTVENVDSIEKGTDLLRGLLFPVR